jgi:hypothetical protein
LRRTSLRVTCIGDILDRACSALGKSRIHIRKGNLMSKARPRLEHMLILLPGITGSVLEKNGKLIWGPAPHALVSLASSMGASLNGLRLQADGVEDDGVRATRIMPYTLIPGISYFDGYTGLHDELHHRFALTEGDALNPDGEPANFFEFPYDWRRCNRISAKRLKELVDRELPKWRKHSGSPDAGVILLCHSMGGLVGRYYVEVLRGFECVRALVTFGTPHRGAIDAAASLANGFTLAGKNFAALNDALKSFPSAYQLLPRYPSILDSEGNWKRPYEVATREWAIDQTNAIDAFAFHEEIEHASARNRQSQSYTTELIPVYGWGQRTYQSGQLHGDGVLDLQMSLPPGVDPFAFPDGDGRVPRVSAIPIPLDSQPPRWWPVNQRHSTLQNNRTLIANLAQMLLALQGDLRAPARGGTHLATERGIALDLAPAFSAGTPVDFEACSEAHDLGNLSARIEPVAGGPGIEHQLQHDGDRWHGSVTGLAVGDYRLTIIPEHAHTSPGDYIADLFCVV